MVTEFAKATIAYMKENLQAEAIASIWFLATVFLLVVVLVLLIFRKTRLWYWKTEEQIQTLRGIDTTLAEIRQSVENVHKSMGAINISDKEVAPAILDSEEADQEVELSEGDPVEEVPKETDLEGQIDDEKEKETGEASNTVVAQEKQFKGKRAQNVGKSGVIYEDEVLRKQIKY